MDFAGFVDAYEELVGRARAGKLVVEDFAGGTVTITNPGTLGTTQSMPRLMRGQGAIVGIGALDYPVEFQTSPPETLRALGIGKIVTLTSTYDHRIIQGAESGLFLKRVRELLVGEHDFYDEVFSSLGVAGEPLRWQRRAIRRPNADGDELKKELMVRSLINMYRVRGHLIARLDPLETEPRQMRADLDPEQYGVGPDDLDRAFHTFGLPGGEILSLAEILEILRDAYCGLGRRGVHAHPESRGEALDPAPRRGGLQGDDARGEAAHPRAG